MVDVYFKLEIPEVRLRVVGHFKMKVKSFSTRFSEGSLHTHTFLLVFGSRRVWVEYLSKWNLMKFHVFRLGLRKVEHVSDLVLVIVLLGKM